MADEISQQILDSLVGALAAPAVVVDGKPVVPHDSRYTPVAEADLVAGYPTFVSADDERATQQNKRKPFENDTFVDIKMDVVVTKAAGVERLIKNVCMAIQHRVATAVVPAAKWVAFRGRTIGEDEENQDILHVEIRFEAYFIAREDAVDTPL